VNWSCSPYFLPGGAPVRLNDQDLVEAAARFARKSMVLTFAYIDRDPRAPFHLAWHDFEELTRDPLCLEELAFRAWLKKEKEQSCYQSGEPRKPRGRPSRLRDEVEEVLHDLIKKGDVTPSTGNKQVHHLVQQARGSLRKISPDTVRRARMRGSDQGAR
jgi:hypothetical protein